MDAQTETILAQLARDHPYAVLVIVSLPGGATFIMALSQFMGKAKEVIDAIRGRHLPSPPDE